MGELGVSDESLRMLLEERKRANTKTNKKKKHKNKETTDDALATVRHTLAHQDNTTTTSESSSSSTTTTSTSGTPEQQQQHQSGDSLSEGTGERKRSRPLLNVSLLRKKKEEEEGNSPRPEPPSPRRGHHDSAPPPLSDETRQRLEKEKSRLSPRTVLKRVLGNTEGQENGTRSRASSFSEVPLLRGSPRSDSPRSGSLNGVEMTGRLLVEQQEQKKRIDSLERQLAAMRSESEREAADAGSWCGDCNLL